MLLATHSIVAASTGEAVANPVLAFLLGVVIHFLLDCIPHYDTTDNGKITSRQIALAGFDALIGLAVLAYLFFQHSSSQLSFGFGAFGGILPDLLSQIPCLKSMLMKSKGGRAFQSLHESIQRIKLTAVPGLLVQLLISVASVYIFLRYVVQ